MNIETINIKISAYPGSILVVRQFSDKAKEEIRAKQQKRAVQKKDKRDAAQECEEAKYIDSEGRECLPVTAVKKSIITAVTSFKDLKKVALRQALFVYPLAEKADPLLVPIETADGKPATGVMREDAVTIGISTRGLAYRPQYDDWTARVGIEYNRLLVSKEQVIALLQQAGWGVGICEGRPEKTSALGWGRFQVDEIKAG